MADFNWFLSVFYSVKVKKILGLEKGFRPDI